MRKRWDYKPGRFLQIKSFLKVSGLHMLFGLKNLHCSALNFQFPFLWLQNQSFLHHHNPWCVSGKRFDNWILGHGFSYWESHKAPVSVLKVLWCLTIRNLKLACPQLIGPWNPLFSFIYFLFESWSIGIHSLCIKFMMAMITVFFLQEWINWCFSVSLRCNRQYSFKMYSIMIWLVYIYVCVYIYTYICIVSWLPQ